MTNVKRKAKQLLITGAFPTYDLQLERMWCSAADQKTKDEGQRSKVGWQNSWGYCVKSAENQDKLMSTIGTNFLSLSQGHGKNVWYWR